MDYTRLIQAFIYIAVKPTDTKLNPQNPESLTSTAKIADRSSASVLRDNYIIRC